MNRSNRNVLQAAIAVAITTLLQSCGALATGLKANTAPTIRLEASSHASPQDPAKAEAAPAAKGPQQPATQQPVAEQEPDTTYEDHTPPPSYGSLDLGFSDTGISFGNSKRWTGIRINGRDHDAEQVTGLNVTLWSPRGYGIDDFDGVAVGVVPTASRSSGLRVGIATIAAESATGIEFGGIATVSKGSSTGIRLAGLASVSGGNSTGMGAAGLASVAEGDMTGIHVSGLATVAEGNLEGIHASGLATVAERDVTGIQVAGLATVAEGSITGLSVAGLAIVGEKSITGIQAAGFATVSEGALSGLSVSGLATIGESSMTGIHAAGLGVISNGDMDGISLAGVSVTDTKSDFWDLMPRRAPGEDEAGPRHRGIFVAGLRADAASVEGVTVAGLINRSHDFDGIGISLHNSVSGMQRGLQVGLVNHAEDLRGVQVGLLNHVPSNPWFLRWLPLVNFRF